MYEMDGKSHPLFILFASLAFHYGIASFKKQCRVKVVRKTI